MKFKSGRPGKLKTALGENIYSRRRMLRMTAGDLARRAEMDRMTITRISQGQQSSRLGTLVAIADALECQVWELLKPGTFQG